MPEPYRPNVNDTINIGGQILRFTEHPAFKGNPYGQTGRRATIYQVVDTGDHGTYYALKVFLQAYRTPRLAEEEDRLRPFATLPGMQVCDHRVLTPNKDAGLLVRYPDLTYAVKMAWVSGSTWEELVLDGNPLAPDVCLKLAKSFLHILTSLEARGMAHCDLSGPNLIIALDPEPTVTLVDVEDLFAPGLTPPEKLPGGSDGYAHRTAPRGLWSPAADRLAGAILLAEMLAWHDPNVVRIAFGQAYFQKDEVQKSGCDRVRILAEALRQHYGAGAAELFNRAWVSNTLDECPTFAQWADVLKLASSVGPGGGAGNSNGKDQGEHPPRGDEGTVQDTLSSLRSEVYRQAGFGSWEAVADLCEKLVKAYPDEKDILPLQARAQRLKALDTEIESAWVKAMQTGRSADWRACLMHIGTARYQAANVARYAEQHDQAGQELELSLQVEQAELMAGEARWDEARLLLQDVPTDHPLASAVRARIDLEVERRAQIEAGREQARSAMEARAWKEAVAACRKALALGGDPGVFQGWMMTAYRELEKDETCRKALDRAMVQAEAGAWDEALSSLEEASAARPEDPAPLALMDEYRQKQTWAGQIRQAVEATDAGRWQAALDLLDGIPGDFMSSGRLAAEAGKNRERRASLDAAEALYDLSAVSALLEGAPGAFDADREWLKAETARRAEITAACEHYDLDRASVLLENAPGGAWYGERRRWLEDEVAREKRFEATTARFDTGAVQSLLDGAPANYPNRSAVEAWLVKVRGWQRDLEAGARVFDLSAVSRVLDELPEGYPERTRWAAWAAGEQKRVDAVEASMAAYDFEAVKAGLDQMPPEHHRFEAVRGWYYEEQRRATLIDNARKTFAPVALLGCLEDVTPAYPHLNELKQWAEAEQTLQHDLESAVDVYDLDSVRSFVNRLPQGHPGLSKQAWLDQETERARVLAEAQERFDPVAVRRLLEGASDRYPGYDRLIAWCEREETCRKALDGAVSRFDLEAAGKIAQDLPAGHPRLGELTAWIEEETRSRDSLTDALDRYDFDEVRRLTGRMPENHPAAIHAGQWLIVESARRDGLQKARSEYDAGAVEHLLSTAPQNDPARHELAAWAKAEAARQAAVRSAIAAFDLDAARDQLDQMPPDHPLYGELSGWVRDEDERRACLATLRKAGDIDQANQALAELPEAHPWKEEYQAWLDALVVERRSIELSQAARAAGERCWADVRSHCQAARRLGAGPADVAEMLSLADAWETRDRQAEDHFVLAQKALAARDDLKALEAAVNAHRLRPDCDAYTALFTEVRSQMVKKAHELEAKKKWNEAVKLWNLLAASSDGAGQPKT